MHESMTRRDFVVGTAALACGASAQERAMEFVLFTDNLAKLKIAEVCAGAKKAGFNGLDLTLRPGGHVLPADAEKGLAEARRAAQAEGLSLPMITTEVTDVDSPHAEAIFAAAAREGVRRIKLGYHAYTPFGTAARQIDETRAKLDRLVRLGAKHGVLPCVHTHSGRYVANGGTALYLLLRDFKLGEIGAYADPAHMTVEGGWAGWEIGLDLIAPWLALLGIKNFAWKPAGKNGPRLRPVWVPLDQGVAPLADFMAYVRRLKYSGVCSLHSEYSLPPEKLLEQSAKDLAYLKSILR